MDGNDQADGTAVRVSIALAYTYAPAFWVRAGTLSVEYELLILVGERAAGTDYAGQWCLPGGKAEPGEAWDSACVRELEEETGLRVEQTALSKLCSFELDVVCGGAHKRVAFTAGCAYAGHIRAVWQVRDSAELVRVGWWTLDEVAKSAHGLTTPTLIAIRAAVDWWRREDEYEVEQCVVDALDEELALRGVEKEELCGLSSRL